MTDTATETFKGLPVLKKTTVKKANLPEVLITPDMEEYSGWDYADHLKWVRDLTGLHIPDGVILATDEDCSEVWLLSRDYYNTTCRLIHRDDHADEEGTDEVVAVSGDSPEG